MPEYGRLYAEGMLRSRDNQWRSGDFVHIARAQQALEDELARHAAPVLVCDTDAFATWLWHELYLGTRSDEVRQVADLRSYALYLLGGAEIPWEDDGTRDRGERRAWFQQHFRDELVAQATPFVELAGPLDARVEQAAVAIDRRLADLG